jgi:hypothetical protein
MQGSNVQEGGQHDMYPRGLTTDNGEWNQPADTTEIVPLIPNQPSFTPPPQEMGGGQLSQQPAHSSEQDWRRMYGQSENEKGELRKSLQAQMDANSQLLQQINQFLTQPQASPTYAPNFPQPPTYQPSSNFPPTYNGSNLGYSTIPHNITPYGYPQPSQPPPRFVEKNDGEMVFAEDVDGAIRGTLNNFVAPVLYNTQEQVRLAREENAQLRQMLLSQEKSKRGITPQIEMSALAERPWIRNLQNNNEAYLGALADYLEVKKAQMLIQRTQPNQIVSNVVPQAVVPNTAQSATRRVTYVEGSNPATQDPGNQVNAFDREMREAAKEPNLSKRAVKMREIFAKHNVREVNDWRDPSVVSR